MKNLFLACVVVGCFAACKSEKTAVGDDSHANMPKAECSSKGECTGAKAECGAKGSCCAAKATPQG